MRPCDDPPASARVPDPDNGTAEQINIERIAVAKAFKDCKVHHGKLADYLKGL